MNTHDRRVTWIAKLMEIAEKESKRPWEELNDLLENYAMITLGLSPVTAKEYVKIVGLQTGLGHVKVIRSGDQLTL